MNLKKALKHGEKIGAEEVEVYYAYNKSISINLKKDQIDLARESISRICKSPNPKLKLNK
ncbi:MAG: hypothetical protein ACE5KT_05310 [Methanosarcinales archaeon]